MHDVFSVEINVFPIQEEKSAADGEKAQAYGYAPLRGFYRGVIPCGIVLQLLFRDDIVETIGQFMMR